MESNTQGNYWEAILPKWQCDTDSRARSRAALILVKFTWNGDMHYSGVEWGLAFPVRAICLHRERDSAPQVPVEGLPVPDEFHGRWYLREYAYWHRSWNIRTPVATSTAAGNSPKGLSSQWPLRCKRLGMKGKAGHAFRPEGADNDNEWD